MKRKDFFKSLTALFLIPTLYKKKPVNEFFPKVKAKKNNDFLDAHYEANRPRYPSEMYPKSRYRVLKQTMSGEEIVVQDWQDIPDHKLIHIGEPMPGEAYRIEQSCSL